MSIIKWLGGAASNTQKVTLTPAGDTATTVSYRVTLTGEDGVPITLATNSSATTVAQIVADVQSTLNASTNVLFDAINWTENGSVVTGEAAVGGVPFYVGTTASTTATATSTFTTATSTANTGPNDWETALNWLTATNANNVPADDDTANFNSGNYSLLHGLRPGDGVGNQGGTKIALNKLARGVAFEGNIGDAVSQIYLQASASTIAINGKGDQVWLHATASSVNIAGTSSSRDAVHLKGDFDNLRVMGVGVQGKVWVADSSVLDKLYVTGVGGQAAVEVGDSVTSQDLVEATAGLVTLKSSATTCTINAAGNARVIMHSSATEATGPINVRENAFVEYNGSGTLEKGTVISGTFSLINSEAEAVTVTNVEVYGGLWTDRSGTANVTYTNDINAYGGQVNTETGTVINYV